MERLVAFAVVFVFACSLFQPSGSLDVRIRTDKQAYASSERIIVSVDVLSSDCNEASVNVIGIRPSSTAYINHSAILQLDGTDEISFESHSPRCTRGCGGVYPGMYNVTATVVACGIVAADEVSIRLVD